MLQLNLKDNIIVEKYLINKDSQLFIYLLNKIEGNFF
jgi:hypothetical protein